MTQENTRYIDSEHYRQRLVKDGDRRFQEWHTNFLQYQKQFLQETSHTNIPSSVQSTPIQSASVPVNPFQPIPGPAVEPITEPTTGLTIESTTEPIIEATTEPDPPFYGYPF